MPNNKPVAERLRFTLRQLEIFAAVARTGQVRRAADVLHLSQAAVSQAIAELADALGVALFERHGREIQPTVAARQLLALAIEPMDALAQLPERLAPSPGGSAVLSGTIRLAASSTIARYVLPAGLARVRQRHPQLNIRVFSGNSAQAEARVANLDADIGLIEGPPQRDDLDIAHWHTDTLQVIAPPGYDIEAIELAHLDRHAWVAREPGSGTRAVFEQNLALAGYTAPPAHLIIDDSGAIVRAVAHGAGLACVSGLAAEQASASNPIQFVALAGLSLARPLWRLHRASTASSTSLLKRFEAELDATLDRPTKLKS
ncbi:amidophosphoribosyltransferase protein [Salinisphaera shabanensis E1L3A]|uniref:Amidophosphoribosyltransferase protein n=1 Tax=Salinisphaera shabanensis E1L3A TaxID=1033802 RepID=F7Q561_9GAMM|nr:LysR substrate-binding domain-containing protein [Salinisphaera shabanensis]ERJ19089.1 amidophosphoribosyltransferase protein [Salinisphaera shabanensis E1L3A]